MNLTYRSHVMVEDLAVGECTIRRAERHTGFEWWELWFRVLRETDQQPEVFAVAVIPGGHSDALTDPKGTDGWMADAWGLNRTAAGIWQVSPSINVLNPVGGRTGVLKDNWCPKCPGASQRVQSPPVANCFLCGGPYHPSLWHQTPAIVQVPDGEPWMP